MIYLLHGDNQVPSRNELNSIILQAKQSQKEIIRLDGRNLKLEELIQALEAGSLFDQDRLVVVEEFFSQKKSKRQEKIIKYLTEQLPMLPQETLPADRHGTSGISLIFWEKKSLTPARIKKFSFINKAKLFKTPAVVFKLVEAIFPSNQKTALVHLKGVLKIQSAEFAFYMIARQIRLLIQAKNSVLPKMAPWMLGKLKSQANKFDSVNKLTKLYKDLLEIDKSIKTGKTPMDLAWHLDLWLVNNLE